MYNPIACILILVSLKTCLGTDDIINKTELVFGFMTHRHGDRVPLQYAIQYMTETDNALKLISKYGYGQLTDRGRRRGYEVGQFIRRRYGSLLSRHYNTSEIYIRSTDSTRAKMTALASMAAVYPPDQQNWSNDVNWTPVPYTTKPIRDDDLLAVVNCPAFIEEFDKRGEKISPELAKYHGLFDELSAILNVNITRDSLTLLRIYDAYNCQTNLEIPINPRAEKLIPLIRQAGSDVMEYLFTQGDSQHLALQAGVLLKEFFTEVDKVINGMDVPRVRVYSGHDVNVYLLAAISKIKPSVGTPAYGSLFSLELRKVIETGQYIVVPVYLSDTLGTEKYLHIDGCGDVSGSCDLHRFRELTSKYLLDVKQWRTLCEYSDDYEIDSSEVD